MATIAWRVAELAEQRGWGARQLAKAAGLDEKTVRNILAGRATRVDLETIARLKLGRAGIGSYLPRDHGGFGSDHEDRAALPAVARARAGELRQPHPRNDTVVVGDTPLDLQAANNAGVGASIGVWSGAATEERLRKERNSGVLPSVAALPDLIKRGLPLSHCR